MLKLVASEDTLSINDGDIVLSRWVCDSHSGKIIVRDAFGFTITQSKLPVETQNGERSDAADVIDDIGANFKGIDFSYYYQWVFTGKSNEISGSSYLNYGWGGEDGNLTIGDVQVATVDTNTIFRADYDMDLWGITITDFVGDATMAISGTDFVFSVGGEVDNFTLSNGDKYWCREQNGIKLYSSGKPINLFVRSTGNGSVDAVSNTLNSGALISITSTPDQDGSEFVKYTKNGVDVYENPIEFNIDEHTEIVSYMTLFLNINSAVGGTTAPAADIYKQIYGDVVSVELFPDLGYEIVGMFINGNIELSNPFDVNINDNINLIPSFQLIGSTPLLPNGYFENTIYFENTKYF